jgi:hypothetical protein
MPGILAGKTIRLNPVAATHDAVVGGGAGAGEINNQQAAIDAGQKAIELWDST